jgi:hypothetical protein
MMKLALLRTFTGKENPELPLLQRINSLELTAPQIAAQINVSQSSGNRDISTSTVQRRLRESYALSNSLSFFLSFSFSEDLSLRTMTQDYLA